MWFEILYGLFLFLCGSAAVYCALMAWHLTTPQGKAMFDKMRRAELERRRRNRIINDWLNGKDEA